MYLAIFFFFFFPERLNPICICYCHAICNLKNRFFSKKFLNWKYLPSMEETPRWQEAISSDRLSHSFQSEAAIGLCARSEVYDSSKLENN